MTEQPQPMSVADFRRFLADRETPKRPNLARAVAEFADANLVVPVLNPIQALRDMMCLGTATPQDELRFVELNRETMGAVERQDQGFMGVMKTVLTQGLLPVPAHAGVVTKSEARAMSRTFEMALSHNIMDDIGM